MRWKVAESSSTYWKCTPALFKGESAFLSRSLNCWKEIETTGLACRSPGYAPVPPSPSPAGSSANVLSDGERSLNEQLPHDQLASMPVAQYPQSGFLPFQYPGANNMGIPKAQVEAHKILLQQQIEVLKLPCLIDIFIYCAFIIHLVLLCKRVEKLQWANQFYMHENSICVNFSI